MNNKQKAADYKWSGPAVDRMVRSSSRASTQHKMFASFQLASVLKFTDEHRRERKDHNYINSVNQFSKVVVVLGPG